MIALPRGVALAFLWAAARSAAGQGLTAVGRPAQLDVRVAGAASIRVTLRPIETPDSMLATPALAERRYDAPAISIRAVTAPLRRRVGKLIVDVKANPLTVTATSERGQRIQELVFETDGTLSFPLDSEPVLGMGEGGPRPEQGKPWRDQPVQFDRRGRIDTMEPRWQSDMYGSRNPVPMLVGTSGWALFVATPWGQVDLRRADRGVYVPWSPSDSARTPQNQRNQGQNLNKGRPPVDRIAVGVYDIFIIDAHDPAVMMRDYAAITGPAAMPPKWAMGYMQSHRTIEDETQQLGIIDTFRVKRIPVDAVIYLGTGFAPRGWNTTQPSFQFNPDVFKRDPKAVIADMHARHVKVAVHIVPFDRDRLASLHGSIPPKPGETLDASHIANYWQQHNGLMEAGIDAFWPDEGDWFNLFERLERHRMYYEWPLSSRADGRAWRVDRNR
jgi:alpha-glucosidase (family GH31 glycosyl hydrolase)